MNGEKVEACYSPLRGAFLLTTVQKPGDAAVETYTQVSKLSKMKS